MCTVTVTGGELSQEEINAYIEHGRQKYGVMPQSLKINVCGDEVELEYHTPKVPFNRLRRITGYLVGDLSRWNNGKRAEEKDRVKHGADI